MHRGEVFLVHVHLIINFATFDKLVVDPELFEKWGDGGAQSNGRAFEQSHLFKS